MFHFFSAIKQNSIDTVTYYNFNESSGLRNGYHICDFGIVFTMTDGYSWNICFDDEYDFIVGTGKELFFGTRKSEMCTNMDGTRR